MNTVFVTVLSGTLVFILGQMLQKFFIQPMVDFRSAKAEALTVMEFYAGAINGNANKNADEASSKLREVAIKIETTYYMVPFVKILARLKLFGLVKESNMVRAFGNLIYFSNSISTTLTESKKEHYQRFDNTFKLLGIKRANQ